MLETLQNHHSRLFDGDDTVVPLDKPLHEGIITKARHNPSNDSDREIEKQIISIDKARKLLARYRHREAYFPFVLVPQEATVQSLARSSPFLLLSILTTAAYSEPLFYHQLEYEFKRVLSSKVICEEVKGLDYLQGLLIYLAW